MRLPAAPATAILPALPRLRGLVAALAGFAAVLMLALLADQALRAIGLPPPAAQLMPELGRQALVTWLRAGCLLISGLLARAAFARRA
ncbi:conserved hypothetical protein [Bosea sp. 62]|uniref:hypothetical protein n=1 Tax=unclassified Bosea (in: a-proteobacteria) TaxID=2653178 RepID=UPI001250F65D|nr:MULTISPECIES: hypothetical protein [unclassified Bosea (in: a-proteobacteria)]CAD5263618.1 conserved hypothetical protein [Bosea sp. 46]CAD5265927.1 conserved hypothetical protein [Bosea sp. 21B]CAD5273817.1 conserved hypothetical protein [Bosea sp. 7B]VVT56659.1 conserved hypothetical protein [Bosea sp. EC-HK365B]VXB77854.1 conserved hypothetical protein [Bosea sp. 29B]